MKFLRFVLLHLHRTWIRTGSTAVALGLCVFLVCALRSVLAEMDSYVETRSPRGLIVSNLVSGGFADGRLTIEAPSEAADGLAALFEGMGRLPCEAGRARARGDGEAL